MALLLLLGDLRWTGAAFLAASVHEMGHLMALWMVDCPFYGVRIDLFGARIETAQGSDRQELLCALAGPGMGLMLCLFWRWLPRTAICAMAQSVFNLLPVYPMDGGRVFRCLRNICCKDGPKGVQ